MRKGGLKRILIPITQGVAIKLNTTNINEVPIIKNTYKIIIISIIILNFFGCNKSDSILSLCGDWEYRTGFDTNWLKKYNPVDWDTISVPKSLLKMPNLKNYSGIVTLRKEIPAKISQLLSEGNPIAINSGMISDAADFYFNEVKFGSLGSIEKGIGATGQYLITILPASGYKKNLDNAIYLKVLILKTDSEKGIRGPYFNIGPAETLIKDYYINVIIAFILITIFAVIGLYHIFLGIRRPKDLHNIYFGIFSFFSTLFFTANSEAKGVIYIGNLFNLYVWADQLSLRMMTMTFILFVVYLYRKKHTIISLIFTAFLLLIICIDLIFFQFWKERIIAFTYNIVNIIIILGFLYTLYETILQMIKKNINAYLLIIGIFLFLCGTVHDILVSKGIIANLPLTSFSYTFFIIGVAGIIANQFINDRNKVEELNTTLEIKNINLKRLYESTLDINSQVSLVSSNLDFLSNMILDYACKFVNARWGSLMLLDQEKNILIIKAVYGDRPNNNELIGKQIPIEKNSPSNHVIKTKKALMIEKGKTKQEINEKIIYNENNNADSFIIEPLLYNDKIYGCINVTNKIDKSSFNNDDISLLNAFSAAASVIIQNAILNKNLIVKNRLEKEMELAKRIQTAILPKKYESINFDIAGLMVPAEEVGGDYFDYILDTSNREWFCIGDVSNHGLTPGLIMMMAQSIINTLIISKNNNPAEVINYLNNVLFENIRNRLNTDDFMTISIINHVGNGKMILAGKHEDIIIYRKKTNRIETISTKGMWVGILPTIKNLTTNITFNLDSGDILLLYTDGVIEALDKNNEQFDIERLSRVILENCNRTPEEIINIIVNNVNNFMNIQNDDITLLVVRKK